MSSHKYVSIYNRPNRKPSYRVFMPRGLAKELGCHTKIGERSKLEDAIALRDKFFEENNLMHLIRDDIDAEEIILDEVAPGIYKEISVPYITTAEDMLKVAKIDTDFWEIDKQIVNAWGVTMKNKNGMPYKTQNHQVKLFLKKKFGEIDWDFLEKKLAKVPRPIEPCMFKVPDDPHALEINVTDVHYGQLCWAPECGEDYDSKIAEDRFMSAITRLLSVSSAFNFEKIYFPIGSDFFNTDTINDTTTAGTPQHNDGRWQKMYAGGIDLIIRAVELLRTVAPVQVILVQGNHDYERSYCAAHFLNGYYRDLESVEVDWRPIEHKFYEYGANMLGWSHGNGPKLQDWLKIMVSMEPEMVGRTKYREVHLGHVHHESAKDQGGVIVRSLGSIAATDAWHFHKGYLGARKNAAAFVYHPEGGLISNMYYNL